MSVRRSHACYVLVREYGCAAAKDTDDGKPYASEFSRKNMATHTVLDVYSLFKLTKLPVRKNGAAIPL